MPRFVERKNIDDNKWNKTIQDSLNSQVYAFTWCLDAICDKWDAIVFGDYEFVLPFANGKKYFLKYAYQPYFTQAFDIYGKPEIPSELFMKFINELKSKFLVFDLSLNRLPINKVKGVELIERKRQKLDLSNSYDAIQSNFSSSHKRNLKKALNNDLAIRDIELSNDTIELITQFYTIKKLKTIKGLRNYFDNISVLNAKKSIRIHGVYQNEKLLNVTLLTNLADKLITMNSISSDLGLELGTTFFAINHVIENNANSDKTLDFEGSNIDSIRRRNIGFGGVDDTYFHLKYTKF